MFADSRTYPRWMVQRNNELLDNLPNDEELESNYKERRKLQQDLQRAEDRGLDVTLADLIE